MRCLMIIILILISFISQALSLRDDLPKRYIVQPGDTLWEIASKYLDNPWEWKILWHANPRIHNPNRLYAGDVIELRYYQRKPYLHVLSNGTIKLSPFVRPSPIGNAIPAIPLMDIKPFLNASLIMDQDRLLNAPYVVAYKRERMLGGQGDELYVKKLHPSKTMPKGATIAYAVYRPGPPYTDPFTGELLGYKASIIGYAELMAGGEPATILLTEITEGVKIRDRVMLNDYPEFDLYFEPSAPLYPVEGRIIELPPAYTRGAVGLVAVINKGQNAGLEAGNVLAIYSPRRVVQDPMRLDKSITLPRERAGDMLIFRTFSKTSLGLVVRSNQAVHLRDIVTNP
ncbi:LysM peptidoglycan-binding domain-containing protein [Legionella sp. CNM-4043-24]|uniref:LysM peptidoglycan-binding domain-containing protein n=1 Tax=Legionella sp. CNM-4043-24 TaxID=3421646 RepID=UPI00403B0D09